MKISLSEIRYVQVYLNMFRVLPYYYIVNHCRFKEKVKEDIDAWIKMNVIEINIYELFCLDIVYAKKKHLEMLC